MKTDLQFFEIERVVEEAVRLHTRSKNTLMLLVGQDVSHAVADVVSSLQGAGIPFFGGVFPHVFLGSQIRTDRCLLLDLPTVGMPQIIEAPFSSENLDRLPEPEWLRMRSGQKELSALVFISGLTLDMTGFTRNLYRKYGVDIRYAGGGTGTRDLDPNVPSVFSSEGLFSNAALIVFLATEVGLGVQHGLRRRLGPYIVTSTDDDRTIHEINWRPALDVFREAILEISGELLTEDNFRRLSSLFPFGLTREGDDDLIRKAYRIEGNSIVCGGNVLSQSPFFIMEAVPEPLFTAAAKATEAAQTDGAEFGFVFECLGRTIHLGEEGFRTELERIETSGHLEGTPCFGVTSLGEISSNKRGLLEFLNMTVVVATFGR